MATSMAIGSILRINTCWIGRSWSPEEFRRYSDDEHKKIILPTESLCLCVSTTPDLLAVNPRERWACSSLPKKSGFDIAGKISVRRDKFVVRFDKVETSYSIPKKDREFSTEEQLLQVFRRWLEDADWAPQDPSDEELEQAFIDYVTTPPREVFPCTG